MSETVDKVADKLMASIQKSQNSTEPGNPQNTSKQAGKSAPKARAASEPGVKKVIDELLSSTSLELPRKYKRNLRWPD